METFDASRPIYQQLMERLELRIVAGSYPPGARLPSVRDLAAEAGVNPNTMQRALAELERMGLLRAERTAGRFVTGDTARIEEVRMERAEQMVAAFVQQMRQMGYTPAELAQMIVETERGETEHG